LLFNKYYVDEIYDFLIVKPYYFISNILFRLVDRFIIETLLIGLSLRIVYVAGYLLRLLQNGYLYRIISIGIIGLGIVIYFMIGK